MATNSRKAGLALALVLLGAGGRQHAAAADEVAPAAPARKLGDVVVYSDDRFYSAFPSIVARGDGELIVAFRRAPNRKIYGEGITHTDANSQLMLVRSGDGGRTWSKEPELILAHPFGGSQDPCMIQLADGSLTLTSYGWTRVSAETAARATRTAKAGDFLFMGGYVMRSRDGGRTWSGPFTPPAIPGEKTVNAFGDPTPAYNRGAPCQGLKAGDAGRVYWVVASAARDAATPEEALKRTENHLMISVDGGEHWEYGGLVARDPKIEFNEASLIQTPAGDWVAFIRAEGTGDKGAMARSTDGGKSFGPWTDLGFQGHPHTALALPDSRVLLVYGYRHPPFGVRARVLEPECRDAASAPEIVLRDDGDGGDLGYPWAANLPGGGVLVVYYFSRPNGTRSIEGTFVEIPAR